MGRMPPARPRRGSATRMSSTPCSPALVPRIDRDAQTVGLGYIVASHARGRGVGTAALRLLTEWAQRDVDAVRIELHISVGNVASRNLAARCGYVREGVLRSMYLKPGVREDTEIWSFIAPGPLANG